MVLEYAETLKSQIGNLYEPEYDKLSLKERIATMKTIKRVMDKQPVRSEGRLPVQPEPDIKDKKFKNHLERAAEGDLKPIKTSTFSLTYFN